MAPRIIWSEGFYSE